MKRLTGLLALAGLCLLPPPARPVERQVDPARSHAEFSVRLLWLHTIRGRFTGIAGTLHPDGHGALVVDADITVDSLRMSSARFRRWVLAPEFFDAARYPRIRFASAPVARTVLEHGGTLDGQLTLRGVTRPVRFEVLPASCPDVGSGPCLIEARGSVQRSDFGMTGHHAVLSNTVKLGLVIGLHQENR